MTALRYILICVLLPVIICSCSKDYELDTYDSAGGDVHANRWIYEQMAHYYYWNAELPEYTVTDYSRLSPSSYFYSIRNAKDRFSYMVNIGGSKSSGGEVAVDRTYDTGFGMLVRRVDFTANGKYAVQIMYVVPDSPADKAGLKRGDMFSAYDSKAISATNYTMWLNLPTTTLTMCDMSLKNIGTVTLKSEEFLNDPIIASKVLDINGRKVAYLAYTHFTTGRNNIFREKLSEAFESFKSEGAEDLILDIRYNSGGELDIALRIASMIAPREKVAAREIFSRTEYNSSFARELMQTNSEYNMRRFTLTPTDLERYNLNLNNLYVITSNVTASAGEVLIHCLKQHMRVRMYGNKATVGKEFGSIEITDTKGVVKLELHPLVVKIFDCMKGPGYPNGLNPDVLASEQTLSLGILGDHTTEPMLNRVATEAFGYKSGTYSSADGTINTELQHIDALDIEL